MSDSSSSILTGHLRPLRAFEQHIIEGCEMTDIAVSTRRREIAVEHVLFKLIEYVERTTPGLLDFIETSLDHLGDPARDDTKDDEAVRDIARRMLTGARHERG